MSARRGVLVGAGGVARLAHLPAYVDSDAIAARLAIVGAIDSRIPPPDVNGLPVRASLGDISDFGRVDFVDVCTPTATHRQLVLDALARGLHVFCEKPVAINPDEARELAAAARSAGRILYPCHQYRENPAWQAMRRWLDDGAIGRWHLAEFNVYRVEADRGAAAGGVPWRGRKEDSLGGVLLDHGTHLLYLLLDVAGMPASVGAHLSCLQHNAAYDVEDTAHLLLDYGRRVATLTLTWAGQQRENRIRFIGDSGMVEWVGGMLRRYDRNGVAETHDFSAQLDKREYAHWMSRTLHGFADAMEQNNGEAGLTEIEQVATLLEGAYRSAAEGRRVDLA
ncbi:MAG TPA: Gfo/Idh/MocA family oxidoreductase [Gemmatimonadales bacterium]|jgi:predicted dehydrogenase|nr:Gfo/Idh/MocA family oxidoreductase [Gemmatimonadales bacterium]